jgi:hypothetical protein
MSSNAEAGSRYHIDLEWYDLSNRSFTALSESRLCADCRDKIGGQGKTKAKSKAKTKTKTKTKTKAKKSESRPDEALLEMTKECCGKKPGFITPSLPIAETLFRLFLANGNEPLTVAEISQQLRQLRVERFAPGPEALQRLLTHENFYGLREVDTPVPETSSSEEGQGES